MFAFLTSTDIKTTRKRGVVALGAFFCSGCWPLRAAEFACRGPALTSVLSLFLADNVPNAVWIWDIQKLKLFVVLEHMSPVRSFQWDPRQPRLAICTGGSKVYLWSPAGCVSVQVPGEGKHKPAHGDMEVQHMLASHRLICLNPLTCVIHM